MAGEDPVAMVVRYEHPSEDRAALLAQLLNQLAKMSRLGIEADTSRPQAVRGTFVAALGSVAGSAFGSIRQPSSDRTPGLEVPFICHR